MEEVKLALFRSQPRSFKLDRRSSEASKLKDAVAGKLPDFLNNYEDDVLAEYIVVLVCNGKHQNQARDDLEDFLGEQSGNFVAWLWKHLSEDVCISDTPLTSLNHIAGVRHSQEDSIDTEEKTGSQPDLHTEAPEVSDFPLSESQMHISSNLKLLDDFQRWCPSIDASSAEVNTEKSHATPFRRDMDSGPADENCGNSSKYCSSLVRYSPQILAGGEQCLSYENQGKKIAKSHSSESPFPSMQLLQKEPVKRSLRSIIAENSESRPTPQSNATERRPPSSAVDALPTHTAHTRGSVWDRLGKPVRKDDDFAHEMEVCDALDGTERKVLDQSVGNLHKSRLMWVVPGSKLSRASRGESSNTVSNCLVSGRRIRDMETRNVGMQSTEESTKRKRNFYETESGNSSMSFSRSMGYKLQKDEASQNSGKKISHIDNGSRSLNVVTTKDRASSTQFLKKPLSTNLKYSVINHVQKAVQDNGATPTKSESLGTVGGNGNVKLAKNEVLDVKLRLHQVEKDMLKLRSMQAKMDTKLNATSGAQNTEEDIETRTVFVTNVHFAAPKEALSSHFSKCGVVAKVIMLMDTITGQPKGAAFIVFSSKESVEKAVSLSGTSFFSRVLTVMRKADMPPEFLVPPLPAGKTLQSWHTQPHIKGSFPKNYSSPHLQWRRDQIAKGGSSLSASRMHGIETSATGE